MSHPITPSAGMALAALEAARDKFRRQAYLADEAGLLLAEIDRLRAEIAALRVLHAGVCDRVAEAAVPFLELLYLGRYAEAAALADSFALEKFEITRQWGQVPYLTRWTLQGQRFEGADKAVFLHRFQRSDADEMHDHPWPFTSIILAGGYFEETPGDGWANGDGPTMQTWYGPGAVLHRPATWIHSVQIPAGQEAWTLILRGVKEKSWGFWCPKVGYRPWREHLAAAEATGHGCGDVANNTHEMTR